MSLEDPAYITNWLLFFGAAVAIVVMFYPPPRAKRFSLLIRLIALAVAVALVVMFIFQPFN